VIEHIEQLRDAATVAHKCSAKHVDSVPIVEMMGTDTVWEGVVEVFEIEGNPNADRCYAWTFQDGGKKRFVTVLKHASRRFSSHGLTRCYCHRPAEITRQPIRFHLSLAAL
jgi:hypothetical protein